jgi:3-hydroxyisobutyrate dehydrogenase-like beta-hydroxyacid dehydrogenase
MADKSQPLIIGIVGVGNMGGPMANRLMDAGHRLVVYDIREEAMAPLLMRQAARAASSREVADKADIVFFSLPTPDDVRGEAIGEAGIIAGSRAKLFVDLSTTGPRTTLPVAEALAASGIAMVDAPVSGGVNGARTGTLSVMAAGAPEHLARVEPLLAIFGKVFKVGEKPGQGQAMKLCNNLISAAALAITSEAMAMGVKAGLDANVMLDVINASTGRNSASLTKFPNDILTRRFNFGFTTALMYKDVRLALQEAEALGVPMFVGGATRTLWQIVNNERGPQSDYTEVARVLEEWSHVEIKG